MLAIQSPEISIWGFVFNMLFAAVFSLLLGFYYTRYGHSLSNRKAFAKNFLMMSMITMLVITIVKSSLALSLGLVGALSIVRFRSAIKEPEELMYLFMAIAIGLGFGADQKAVTIAAFGLILGALFLRSKMEKTGLTDDEQNLHLNIALNSDQEKIDINKVISILKNHCEEVSLKRFDETKNSMEASFFIKYNEFEKLNQTRKNLRELSDSLEITFLDNKIF